MNRLKEKFSAISVRLEMLSLRERAMILLASLAVIYFVAQITFLGPFEQSREHLRDQKARIEERITQLSQTLALLERQTRDPNAALKKKIARLENDIRQLDRQLHSQSLDLVAPREIPQFLESFLAKQQKLHLVSLENQPAVPLVERGKQANDGKGPEQGLLANVYRHTVRMEFEGTYLDTLHYLQALEGLSRSLFWESIDIEVINHPQARIVLQVYTLSLSKGWIGV